MKVLIVDDTAFMRATIRRILEKCSGYEIFEAVNGLEAVKKYKMIQPDFVIMDISMPVMDGIEAVRQIKAFDKETNIIICSLQGQKNNVMEAIKSGARSFLVKPVKEDKLMAEISKLPKRSEHKPVPVVEETEEWLAHLEEISDSPDNLKKSEAYLKGLEDGYLEARKEIATNMIRFGISLETIMSCVEITNDLLNEFKEEYKL